MLADTSSGSAASLTAHPLAAGGTTIAIYNMFAKADRNLLRCISTDAFRAEIEDRTSLFVGRGFIFSAIDQSLSDPDFPSGYIVIRGEPGIGKTALAAQLVKERAYVHHFNIASQGIQSTRHFLCNICAQLIIRYGLGYSSVPEEATSDSGFLSRLLAEAAAKETVPIVILVDALDEADPAALGARSNPLYLPQTLPPQVYFIVTTREQFDLRLVVDRRRPDIYLRDEDERNLSDVEAYIRAFVDRYPDSMKPRISKWAASLDEFIETLTARSEGNFMYLVYTLRDMQSGLISPENLKSIRSLPLGLRAYYYRHWVVMGASNDQASRDVICLLATAREPVTAAKISEWAQVPLGIVNEALRKWWEFMNVRDRADGEIVYALYHASFRDFLKEEVGLTPYHRAIASTALRKIPGFTDPPPAGW